MPFYLFLLFRYYNCLPLEKDLTETWIPLTKGPLCRVYLKMTQYVVLEKIKTWTVNRQTTDNFHSWSEKLTRTFSLLGELKITCFYYIVGTRYFLTISACVQISIMLGNFFPASFLWTLFIYNSFLHCSRFLKNFF